MMSIEDVKAKMNAGQINLKWRECPSDATKHEIYIKQTDEVVFVGTPKESTKYINEVLFGKGGCRPPM